MKVTVLASLVGVAFLAQQVGDEPAIDWSREFDGLIEPARVVQLSPPVNGILETVAVERGDLVTEGQVVANLESSVEKATVELNEARTKLVAELKKQKARLRYTESKLAYDEELYQTGILSEDEIEQTRTDRLLAEASYLQAQENIQIAELERKRAAALLEQRTVRSPIGGVVTERFLSAGELVTRQYQSKILEIAQIDSLVAEVMLPASLFQKVAVGMSAQVRPDVRPQDVFDAKVKTVDRVVDTASGTFRVRLEINDVGDEPPAGLKCRVRFSP